MLTKKMINELEAVSENVDQYDGSTKSSRSHITKAVNAVFAIVKKSNDKDFQLAFDHFRTPMTAIEWNAEKDCYYIDDVDNSVHMLKGAEASSQISGIKSEAQTAYNIHRRKLVIDRADRADTQTGVNDRLAFFIGNRDSQLEQQKHADPKNFAMSYLGSGYKQANDDTQFIKDIENGYPVPSLRALLKDDNVIYDNIKRGRKLMKKQAVK